MLIRLLIESPLLLLFCVSGAGCLLGKLPVLGVRFGVSAVLFTGLAISSLDPRLALPDIIYIFGLVLFVYTTGMGCGPAFFLSLRKSGLRDNALVAGVLAVAAALTYGLRPLLQTDICSRIICG